MISSSRATGQAGVKKSICGKVHTTRVLITRLNGKIESTMQLLVFSYDPFQLMVLGSVPESR